MCQCDSCVSRFEHELDWPCDALWKTSVGNDLLWAHTRDELVALRQFIETEGREPDNNSPNYYFVRHVPKVFLNVKRRSTTLARISRLLESEPD